MRSEQDSGWFRGSDPDNVFLEGRIWIRFFSRIGFGSSFSRGSDPYPVFSRGSDLDPVFPEDRIWIKFFPESRIWILLFPRIGSGSTPPVSATLPQIIPGKLDKLNSEQVKLQLVSWCVRVHSKSATNGCGSGSVFLKKSYFFQQQNPDPV